MGQGLILGLGVVTGVVAARLPGSSRARRMPGNRSLADGDRFSGLLGISQAAAYNVGRKAFTVSEVSTAAAAIGVIQSALAILLGLIAVHFVLARYSPTVQHLGVVAVLCSPAFLLGGYPQGRARGYRICGNSISSASRARCPIWPVWRRC